MWNTKSSLWFKTKSNCRHIYVPSYFSKSHHLEVTESAAEEKGAMVWEGEGEGWR